MRGGEDNQQKVLCITLTMNRVIKVVTYVGVYCSVRKNANKMSVSSKCLYYEMSKIHKYKDKKRNCDIFFEKLIIQFSVCNRSISYWYKSENLYH